MNLYLKDTTLLRILKEKMYKIVKIIILRNDLKLRCFNDFRKLYGKESLK